MTVPLIHIGLHRTGSTWLQKVIFNGEDGRPVLAVPNRIELNERLVVPRNEDFDAKDVREWIEEKFASFRASNRPLILSNERFSGNPHSGWFDTDRILDRLAEVLAGARILLVVREQKSLIRSLWLQYIRIGGTASLQQYLSGHEEGDYRAPVFDASFLRFHNLVASLDARFGQEKVLVLPFELLKKDAGDFLSRIQKFGEFTLQPPADLRPEYAAPRQLTASLARWVNIFMNRSTLNRGAPLPSAIGSRLGMTFAGGLGRLAGRPIENRLRRRSMARIAAQPFPWKEIAESNAILAGRMEFDLAEYGYSLPA
ncbi:MAG: hypothetical protein MK085_06460 [Phycisphaerales bacterium]|nr:hypothetical protein [Phycisphaerales bacterium]